MEISKLNLQLDEWQKEVLETEGNICLRSGRQVGKSTIISVKSAEFAIRNKGKTILVIASVERQAYLLFEKILSYLEDNYKNSIKTGKDRPTKHKITLKNGSVIYSLPTGLTAQGIRGFTIDLLIADEAAFIPEEVWTGIFGYYQHHTEKKVIITDVFQTQVLKVFTSRAKIVREKTKTFWIGKRKE